MIDSTPHPLLDETAGSVSASPYGGGGRRAVMPKPASNPLIGQSPASPYTAGFTEPLVRRAAPARTVPSAPAPFEPVSLASPVPAPSPRHETDEDARLEEPSPYESTPYEPSPSELSPTELSPTEPEPLEPGPGQPSSEQGPAEPGLTELSLTEPEPVEPSPPEPESLEPSTPPSEPSTPPSELAEPTADPDDSKPLLTTEDVEDEAIEAVAVAEEPVVAVTDSSRVTSIPWISRTPGPSVTEDMSAAQAYTTPLDPSMWFIGPLEETQAPPFVRVRHHGPERVDRGLLFASIPLILGWAVSAALFHLGHIPSIVALAMAPAGAFLYGKGAGSRPQAGAVRLVALLVVGVLLAWPISLATELSFYYEETTGTTNGAIGYVVSSMVSATLFVAKLKELLLVALFGLVGVIAVVQTIVSTRRRRRSDAS